MVTPTLRADENGLDQLTALVSSALASTEGERRWPAAHIAQGNTLTIKLTFTVPRPVMH